MSRKDKLLARVRSRPRDFTWDETCSLLRSCGYELRNGTRGSRRCFIHAATGFSIHMHEPHGQNCLKRYQVDDLITALMEIGEISNDDA